MKKNVFEMVVALVNGREVADMETLRNEINAEWERMAEKKRQNSAAYDAAKEVAFGIICDSPMTVKEIFAASDEWPEGFTASKLQYAMREYWRDEVEKHENGKNPLTYTIKSAD